MGARADAVAQVPNFEELREAAKEIRNRSLESLDLLLEQFEKAASGRGARVHWAETPEAAARIVCEIAKAHGVRKAVKSKSMVSEECNINDALAQGVQVGSRPRHIPLATSRHPTSRWCTRPGTRFPICCRKHGTPRTDIAALCRGPGCAAPLFPVHRHGHLRRQLSAAKPATLIVTNGATGAW